MKTAWGAIVLLAMQASVLRAAEEKPDQPALMSAGEHQQLASACHPFQVRVTPSEAESIVRLRTAAPSVRGGLAAYGAGVDLARSSIPADPLAARRACAELVRKNPIIFEFFDLQDDTGAPPEAMRRDALTDQVRKQVQRCWMLPVGWMDAAEVSVTVRFKLNLDGTVGDVPSLLQYPSGRYGLAAAEGAIRAVLQCGPYQLPLESYADWQEVEVRLSPEL